MTATEAVQLDATAKLEPATEPVPLVEHGPFLPKMGDPGYWLYVSYRHKPRMFSNTPPYVP